MATLDTETLAVTTRTETGSRAMRRLRRAGRVPGVLYGGGEDALTFEADAREMRNALAHSGAVMQITIDGGAAQPVQVKAVQRHPVRGEVVHADFVRVRMDVAIHAAIPVEVINADAAPGIVAGGVLTQEHREVNVEALPGDIPDSIVFDASGMEINETALLSQLTAPPGVTFLDDPDATVIATITPPTQEPTEDEIETETGVVGEEGEVAEAQAEGATEEEAQSGAEGGEEAPSE
jgi:large subunit ribosomal protein L25